METKPFLAFFRAQIKMLKSQMIAFSFLSIILIVGFSLLSIKGNFVKSEFSESFGLIVWIMIGLMTSNIAAGIGVDDFSKRTGLIILSQPADRKTIIIARIIACFVFMILPLSLIYISGIISAFTIYKFIMPNLIFSFLLALFYTFSFIVFVTGIGAISKNRNTPLSVGLTVSLLAVFVFAVFGKLLGIEPWFFLPYGGLIISNIITVPALPHINPENFFFYYTPYVLEALIIMLAYSLIFICISFLAYIRRQI